MSGPQNLDRRELEVAERALLLDAALYTEKGGLSLRRRSLLDLTIHDIAFEGSDWQGARIDLTNFVDCSFRSVDFSQAELAEVSFLRCAFDGCRCVETLLTSCRLSHCKWTEGIVRDAVLMDCQLEQSELVAVTFDRVRFDGVSIEAGKLSDSRLAECQIHLLEIAAAAVDNVRLTLCQVGRLSVRDCHVTGLALLGGSAGSIQLHGGTLKNVSLAELACNTVSVQGPSLLFRFRVLSCEVERMELLDCAQASGMYMFDSRLAQLRLGRGNYMGWVTECKLGPGSEVVDATLTSFFWDKSEVEGLLLRRVRFEDFLSARETRFSGLQIVDATYEAGLRLVLDDAQFLDRSARFPGDRP